MSHDSLAPAIATPSTTSRTHGRTPGTAAKPAGRATIKKNAPKAVRKDGTVKTTILLDAWTDKILTHLAYTREADRSELVRHFLGKALKEVDLEKEADKARKRLLAMASKAAGPKATDADSSNNRPAEGTEESSDDQENE